MHSSRNPPQYIVRGYPPVVHGYPPIAHGYPPNDQLPPSPSTVHIPWLPQTNITPPPPPPMNPSGADLFRAVESGDLTMVHYLVSKNEVDPSYADPTGNTALHVSARKGYSQISHYLIEQGLNPNIMNERGHTPLMWAVTNGHLGFTASLIKKGADPNLTDSKGFNAVIHAAVSGHLFILHYLIATAKVEVNIADREGRTALSWASSNGHQHIVDYLLGHHCPAPVHIGIVDSMGRTPLHWAAQEDKIQVAAVLRKATCRGCNLAEEDEIEKVGCRAKQGSDLLAIRDVEGQTPLECARMKKNEEMASVLNNENSTKKDKNTLIEPTLQFLSSFLPHFILFQYVTPSYPFWVVFLCMATIIWVHGNIAWSTPEKTLVPAGLMSSAIILMITLYTRFELSTFSLFLVLIGISVGGYTFYCLMVGDPGRLKSDEHDIESAFSAAAFGVEPQEFCRICMVIKTPRAKHCRVCGFCCSRFDHHCFWIYNCVAEKNIWLFYVFLIQFLVHVFIFIIYGLSYLYKTTVVESVINAFYNEAQVAWAVIFFVVAFFPVMSLFAYHTNFISRDVTTYELMRPVKGTNPHSQKPSLQRLVAFVLRGPVIFSGPPFQTMENV